MPPSRQSWKRTAFLAIVLVGVVGFVIWKASQLLANPAFFPPDDFVEYWAAGHLNAHGQNPYDGELLLPLERAAGRDTDAPIMMWNPPWTLTLVMPVGLAPARYAQLAWLAISFALVIVCGDQLWFLYGGAGEIRWVSWLVGLTFLPTLFVLQSGQIGPFILLGTMGFLHCFAPPVSEAERGWKHLWLAGACGVLMAIKPHLLYLFWIALIAWAAWRPFPMRWKVLAGGAIAGFIATLIPLACNPEVISQYRHALLYRTPDQWKSPTIGSYLREALGDERFGLQFVPTIIGVAWLAADLWRQRARAWSWAERMPMLILVSFATASYGAWPFDLVILLPAVIEIAAGLSFSQDRSRAVLALGLYVAINLAALTMNILAITSDKFVWMAPTILLGYVLLRPRHSA